MPLKPALKRASAGTFGSRATVLFVSLDTFAECSRVLELNQRPPEPKKPILLVFLDVSEEVCL